MSIKPEFDPSLNEYIFSFTGMEIVSVISLTEHIQKRSVKGIPGIHRKSMSMSNLLENTSRSVAAARSVFYGKKGFPSLQLSNIWQQDTFQESCSAWWPDITVYQTSDAQHGAPYKTPPKVELQCSVLTFLSCTHYVLKIWCLSTFGVRKGPSFISLRGISHQDSIFLKHTVDARSCDW